MTELVFILDKSGSMSGLEADTIGGFNSMIEKQKREAGRTYVSTVLFSSHSTVIHDRVPLEEIEPMTEQDYVPGGSTALLDAVGKAIHHMGNVHKYARPEDRPDRTMFIITTDGEENASGQYTYPKVKHMIERQQTRYDWEFVFLGANIDAAAEAKRMGIRDDRTARYCCTPAGISDSYDVFSDILRCFSSDQTEEIGQRLELLNRKTAGESSRMKD